MRRAATVAVAVIGLVEEDVVGATKRNARCVTVGW
jgi:hypothetical protein